MGKTVDFYFGLGSRYSYLAATRIARFERETGAVVRWHPLTSGSLIAETPHDPFSGPLVSGQYEWDYRRRDAEDWAAFYGVPFRDPMGRLSYPNDLPTMASLAAGRQDVPVPVCHAVFRLIFVDDCDADAFDAADIAAETGKLGLNPARFGTDLDGEVIRTEHATLLEQARSREARSAWPSSLWGTHVLGQRQAGAGGRSRAWRNLKRFRPLGSWRPVPLAPDQASDQ